MAKGALPMQGELRAHSPRPAGAGQQHPHAVTSSELGLPGTT